MNNEPQYVIEMLHITKEFPGIKANDDITLQLRRGEIHALLGENGAGKSTLMSVLFGLYQPEEGVIKKDGKVIRRLPAGSYSTVSSQAPLYRPRAQAAGSSVSTSSMKMSRI